MKINVTVDLEDFYNGDDEATFSEQIKNDISYRVRQEVWKDFEKKSLEKFTDLVKAKIEKESKLKIKQTYDDLFEAKKIKERYGSEMVSISEYIKQDLDRNHLDNGDFDYRVKKLVEKHAAVITKDLKDRYDLLFASQLVSKMNAAGMLKENVAKLLLNDPNESN